MPSQDQQTTVAAYFAEAATPSVIGTTAAQPHLLDAITTAGNVLEQTGKSRRLLNVARLAEADEGFNQDAEGLSQALTAAARDCEEVQRLLLNLAQQSAKIDAANAKLKATATALGYTLP